uniref:LMBR1 domain-containing protein 2-like n=1 Tax=Phallusia mammillata TaxID=59560 RepID=A0A6F9DJ06_9ASCI|nr:LMBR1 domain-containing protein 2-like [Phallusia mammillata]
MSVGPLVLELIVVFCIALLLLHHYGKISKYHPIVIIATLVAWYFSLIIVFVLPLDVSSTFYRQCITTSEATTAVNGQTSSASPVNVSTNSSANLLPDTWQSTTVGPTTGNVNASIHTMENVSIISTSTVIFATNHSVSTDLVTVPVPFSVEDGECKKPWSYVPIDTLPAMWHIVYWTSQVLTWFILPFMQSYVCAGDFSVLGKLKRAVFENAFYYGSYLLIFGGLLIYVAASPQLSLDFAQLKVLLITASNTWGLFLLVLLLGYGLVEVPRKMWDAGNISRTTAWTYFQLARLSTEKQEANEDLEDILEEVKKVSGIVRYNHPVRKFVNIIISKCPDAFQTRVSQGMDDYEDYDAGRSRSDLPTEKTLVRIHRQIIRAVHTQKRTTVQWKILMRKALHLETISKNLGLIDRRWKEEFPSDEDENYCYRTFCSSQLKWYWYCLTQPALRKTLAICLAVLSLMVVWSECTFFNESPVLSLFAIFINLAKQNYDYFYIELASCLIISYLCVCAYYTVFRIKFFNYYYIAGHHQTDESSLMFVGIMFCRLTAPLCLNFLGLIHLDTHITGDDGVETSYTKIMGHLDVISFISDGFNIYFPILVCVLCCATYFSLGQRCLSAVGFQRFIDEADDMTTDLVDEGRQLVNREKRRLQRELNSLKRAERDNGEDISSRQWKGRTMRQAEAGTDTVTQSPKRYKRKTDKLELLTDAEPIDYSSVSHKHKDDLDDSGWGNDESSEWGTTSTYQNSTRSNLSTRPPKNLFDDV